MQRRAISRLPIGAWATLSLPTVSPEPALSGVRAVCFDLDDTLCAYWEAARAGLRRALEGHSATRGRVEEMEEHWAAAFRDFYPRLRPEGWYEEYLASGEPTRTELMRRALLRAEIEDPEVVTEIADAYARERLSALRLFPDALPVLKSLKKRYGLGLITNGPADVQSQEIEALGVGSFFDCVLIEGEIGIGKPEPEVFRRAEQELGWTSGEMLFVGNSYSSDILPAIEAGWRAVWVRRPEDVAPSQGKGGKPEAPPQDSPPPHAITADLRSLLPLLGMEDLS